MVREVDRVRGLEEGVGGHVEVILENLERLATTREYRFLVSENAVNRLEKTREEFDGL